MSLCLVHSLSVNQHADSVRSILSRPDTERLFTTGQARRPEVQDDGRGPSAHSSIPDEVGQSALVGHRGANGSAIVSPLGGDGWHRWIGTNQVGCYA